MQTRLTTDTEAAMIPMDNPITPDLPSEACLAIQLHGRGVALGTVSAGTVCRYVERLRLGLQAAIEIVEPVRAAPTAGRRKRWVERMADLPLLAIESGSVRVLLGEPLQEGLFAEAERASFSKAVDLVFQGLSEFAAAANEPPWEDWPSLGDAAQLRLLDIVAKLMPPRRGPLNRITLWRHTAEGETHQPVSITLDRRSRDRVEAEIERRLPPADIAPWMQGQGESGLLIP